MTLDHQNDLLVAILPRRSALDILKTERWYHVPVVHAPGGWPPKMLAFYQGKVFGEAEAYKIRHFGEVRQIDVVPRRQLFPNDEKNAQKAENLYYRLELHRLEERKTPIVSYRPRRLAFIPTTWEKFEKAEQVNDLFNASPLEDELWNGLKKLNVFAERQWKIVVQDHNYYLDFAVFCNQGKLAIETDGYAFHYDSRNQIDYQTWRQNEIELDGWNFLHYTTRHISENPAAYLAQIEKKINRLGGAQSPEKFVRKFDVGRYIVDGEEPF